jgi:ketosteroid isomerase-like protein
MTPSEGAAARRSAWISAVEAGVVENYAALVTEDVVWLPPYGTPVEGRAAFAQWLKPFMENYEYSFIPTVTASQDFAGWAWETGLFRSSMQPREGGVAQEHNGEYFILWRKDPDGAWRIERYVDIGPPGR